MPAPFVYDGAVNGNLYLAHVELGLVPTLSEGDVVVMDNLPAHTVAGGRDAVGALVDLFTPAESANRFKGPGYEPD